MGTACAAAARGRRLEAATTWPGGLAVLYGGRYGWSWCLGKLGCNGGCCAWPCTATGAACRAPSISTHLGRADRPICGMVHMCGDKGMRQGDYGSRVGSRGGRGDGLQPAAGLCLAVQRDRVRTRRRRLHG